MVQRQPARIPAMWTVMGVAAVMGSPRSAADLLPPTSKKIAESRQANALTAMVLAR